MSYQITRKTKAFSVALCVLTGLFFGTIRGLGGVAFQELGVREPEMFKRSWDYKVSPNLAVIPAIDSSAVYFVDTENNLLAIDSTNASRIWSSELGGEVASNLLLSDRSILLVTNSRLTDGGAPSKTFLRSISRDTGITEWRVEIGSASNVWIGAYPNAVIVVGENGLVSALSHSDGKPVWERKLGVTVTTVPMFGPKGIAFGTVGKEILDVAVADGASRTLWKSEQLPTALVADGSGRLVIGDDRGSVTAVGANGERSWAFRNGARISSVLLGDSDYLASSNDNFVYRLTRGGNVRWKRRLPGRLSQAPLILDDVAVLSVSGGGGVFVIDVNKGKVLDRIETSEDLSFAVGGAAANSKNFVVAGPSGVSYFSREGRSAK